MMMMCRTKVVDLLALMASRGPSFHTFEHLLFVALAGVK